MADQWYSFDKEHRDISLQDQKWIQFKCFPDVLCDFWNGLQYDSMDSKTDIFSVVQDRLKCEYTSSGYIIILP